MLEQTYALLFAVLLFLLGSKIYALRSSNRRTDPKKRRKKGLLPIALYEHTPALYLLMALLLLKLDSRLAPVLSLMLLSYALYIGLRRTQYRKHRIVAAPLL
ncbi:hypothetical protein ACVBJC_08520 [Shewanella sp. 0m-6]